MRLGSVVLACSLARGPCGGVRGPDPVPHTTLWVADADRVTLADVEVGAPFEVRVPVHESGEGSLRTLQARLVDGPEGAFRLDLDLDPDLDGDGRAVALRLVGVADVEGTHEVLLEHPDETSLCGGRQEPLATVVLEVHPAVEETTRDSGVADDG